MPMLTPIAAAAAAAADTPLPRCRLYCRRRAYDYADADAAADITPCYAIRITATDAIITLVMPMMPLFCRRDVCRR